MTVDRSIAAEPVLTRRRDIRIWLSVGELSVLRYSALSAPVPVPPPASVVTCAAGVPAETLPAASVALTE